MENNETTRRRLSNDARNLNYSNQMDSEEHRWAALCNLLDDFLDTEDLTAHDRRVAREGFGSDSELCGYMADRIFERAEKLTNIAKALKVLSAMHVLLADARSK